jgi:putative DNA primase/helicase
MNSFDLRAWLDQVEPPAEPKPESGPAAASGVNGRPTNGPTRRGGGRPGAVDRAIAYLDKVAPAISGQHGHDALLWAATAMAVGFDLAPEVAVDLLVTHYNSRCQPSWDLGDIQRKVEQANAKATLRRGSLLDTPAEGAGGAGGRASAEPDGHGPSADGEPDAVGTRRDGLVFCEDRNGELIWRRVLARGEVVRCHDRPPPVEPNYGEVVVDRVQKVHTKWVSPEGFGNDREVDWWHLEPCNGIPLVGGSVSFVSSVSTQEGAPPEFSGPPRAIVAVLRPVPAFDPELLPTPFRAWVQDIAARMQCAIEFVAVGVVVVLATLTGRKIVIRPKEHDDWCCVPNLWAACVGRPGVLKSPALRAALDPLRRLSAEAMEKYEGDLREFSRDQYIASAQREATKDRLKKAAKEQAAEKEAAKEQDAGKEAAEGQGDKAQDAKKKRVRDEDLKALAEKLLAGEPAGPTPRRYEVNDPTVEKLMEIFRDNPVGLLLYRDELAGWLYNLDRPGHEGDRQFYIEAWDGLGSHTQDRITRGTIHAKVCLSILGSIQPGPLAAYIRAATRPKGDDGLISRLQLVVFPDQDREFQIVDRKPDVGARNRAMDIFRKVDRFDPRENYNPDREAEGQAEGPRSPAPEEEPYVVHFAADAQAFFFSWLTALETTKLRANESEIIESHLAKYRSLMPSLALLFHVVDHLDPQAEPKDRPPLYRVSLVAARRAAAWCTLLEEHARRAYEHARDGDTQGAQTLAERIGGLPNPFTARDVQRKQWSGLTSGEDVERALLVLEEREWVKGVDAPPGGKGGRPSTQYHINPNLGGVQSELP